MHAIANRLRVDIVLDPMRPSRLISGTPIEVLSLNGRTDRVVLDPNGEADVTLHLVDIDRIAHLRQSRLTASEDDDGE